MIVYICSPYGGLQENVDLAHKLIKLAIALGHSPIAPHVMYHKILDDFNPLERAIGLDRAKNLLKACDEIWIPGWCKTSSGMEKEIQLSRELGIPQREIMMNDVMRCNSLGITNWNIGQ
jgi:hypothetical protein